MSQEPPSRMFAPARRSAAFTLLELILGMSVMVGILAAAYLCLHAGFESQEMVESRMDASQNARVAMALLAADLRAACRLSDEYEFVGLDRALGSMEADNLDFATHNWAPTAPGEGDFCEISYYVDRNLETGEFGLWRRRDASPDHEPLAGGLKEEIAAGLRGFRLEYYDGFSWYESWGEVSQAERGGSASVMGYYNLYGLPAAVRITLAFSEGAHSTADPRVERERPDAPLVFQTIVFLNLADRAFAGSTDAGTEGGN